MDHPPALDHIIILLPHKDVLSPPSWLTDAFTITPGGRHADNKTENKLIIFKNGTYIELIAFLDDSPNSCENHWWGDKDYGFIDWALTSSDPQDVEAVRSRLEKLNHQESLPVSYGTAQEGGRRRADGQEVKWKVTFPSGDVKRGEVPFWCHDSTPRELRVPVDEGATTHPCGAVGVAKMCLVVPDVKRSGCEKFYSALLGRQGGGLQTEIKGEDSNSRPFLAEWELASPDTATSSPVVLQVTNLTSLGPDTATPSDRAFLSGITLLTEDQQFGQRVISAGVRESSRITFTTQSR